MTGFDTSTGVLLLKVENRFKKTMTCKAEMRWPSRDRRKETSGYPVMPGLLNFEGWPHPIEELALYNFGLNER
jgi:hypothetical protein